MAIGTGNGRAQRRQRAVRHPRAQRGPVGVEAPANDNREIADRFVRTGGGRRVAALPSGRAALGALLVTIAALITFVAYARSHGPARGHYLVATHDLVAGSAVSVDDVRIARVDVPNDIAPQLLQPGTPFDGVVALGPIRAGQFLQAGNLIRKPAGAQTREISLALDAAQAAGGHLLPGDRVDLLATFGTGNDAHTEVVLTNAPVVRIDRGDASITANRGAMNITLAFEDPAIEQPLAQAIAIAKVQLVRTTGANTNSRADPAAGRKAIATLRAAAPVTTSGAS